MELEGAEALTVAVRKDGRTSEPDTSGDLEECRVMGEVVAADDVQEHRVLQPVEADSVEDD